MTSLDVQMTRTKHKEKIIVCLDIEQFLKERIKGTKVNGKLFDRKKCVKQNVPNSSNKITFLGKNTLSRPNLFELHVVLYRKLIEIVEITKITFIN